MPPIRKSFQLDPEQDATLIAWLTSFADRYKMSDLIKLALYHLAEIEPSGDLGQLQSPQEAPAQLSLFEAASSADPEADADAADAPNADTSAQFDAILQELTHLREALLTRLAQEEARAASRPAAALRAVTPSNDPPRTRGEVESSGIDMSRPRRPSRTKRATPPPDEPQERALDPDALARELLRSIGSFGQDG
ncbi:MAG: hypothetical protein K8S97_07065 [Anaerolineae bacterium]|nr:hypothetical protein [Anaerolineae bacterium]